LDVSQELGSRFVITLGGFKREREVDKPKLYFAATDKEMASELLSAKAEIIKGQIFGVAGLLVGIGRLRGFRGCCLLAETLGLYPDSAATREVLKAVCRMLNLKVNFDNLDATVEVTRNILENFGLLERSAGERRKEESQFRWFI
jgi:proteasome assembly chaperone (PAC2) family protein